VSVSVSAGTNSGFGASGICVYAKRPRFASLVRNARLSSPFSFRANVYFRLSPGQTLGAKLRAVWDGSCRRCDSGFSPRTPDTGWKPMPQRGWRTQPRVSTLGTNHPVRRALKGRQIERTSNVKASSNCGTSQLRILIFAAIVSGQPLAPSGRTRLF
jgi:hypothetical protein